MPLGGANALGFSGFGSASTAPSGYAGSDVYQEKQEARERWRSNSPTSLPQSPTGLPAANPTGAPARGSSPQQSPTCKTCNRAKTPPRPAAPRAEPPKLLWDPTRAAVERPAPQLDWAPRDPRDVLSVIAASYSSADLLAMLTLVPNMTPSTETAPGPRVYQDSGSVP
ncbi:hypothetical protein [Kitasatospora sp. NPDC087315]|uniref:hypothetical protein n=1 Tax=Kitasatospora sp. NPDC087315 TaxID=3364069 RepID=UPI0038192107